MKVTIYGKENCSFCKRSVSLCKRKDVDYNYITIVDNVSDNNIEATKSDVEKRIGHTFRTVPKILMEIDGKEEYIGGFDELNQYFRELREK